jgi:C4-dicarboxylate-specific signal transduction histidine kinase
MASRGKLMDGVYRLSLLISTASVILVQAASIPVMAYLTAADFNRSGKATADEIASILTVPMYNVDNAQTLRIAETLLSSERVAGVFLTSTASGVLVDRRPARDSGWVRSQSRSIEYRGIELGRLEIYFSDAMLGEMGRRALLAMLAIVAVLVGTSVAANRMFIRNRVRGIFGGLIEGIEGISKGDYGLALGYSGYEDTDSIVRVVNEMSDGIRTRNEQLLAANAGLEGKVAERTAELESALREQRLLQERLIQAGKLAALGQLSAGIAHELNTPLGAIRSSAGSLIEYFDESLPALPRLYRDLDPAERRLFDEVLAMGLRSSRDLAAALPGREAARKVAEGLRAEGIDDRSDLAEAIAETGLAESVELIRPLLGTGRDEEILRAAAEACAARRLLEVIDEASRGAASVVVALRSHLSPQAGDETSLVDVPADIGRVLTLMRNMLKRGVSVKTRFAPARVRASGDKLSQVWMNIIKNAAQAMDFRGELAISVERSDGAVRITFADDGPGIPEELRERVFEPFFTTKRHGDGMGLGLDVSRKIVESYGGSLSFESRPGRTVFSVELPAADEGAASGN